MVKEYSWYDECHLCSRIPSTGFLYSCEENTFPPLEPKQLSKAQKKLLKGKRRVSADLELVGVSRSMIEAIGNGHYNKEQINLIKRQKAHVRSTIGQATKKTNTFSTKNRKHFNQLNMSIC